MSLEGHRKINTAPICRIGLVVRVPYGLVQSKPILSLVWKVIWISVDLIVEQTNRKRHDSRGEKPNYSPILFSKPTIEELLLTIHEALLSLLGAMLRYMKHAEVNWRDMPLLDVFVPCTGAWVFSLFLCSSFLYFSSLSTQAQVVRSTYCNDDESNKLIPYYNLTDRLSFSYFQLKVVCTHLTLLCLSPWFSTLYFVALSSAMISPLPTRHNTNWKLSRVSDRCSAHTRMSQDRENGRTRHALLFNSHILRFRDGGATVRCVVITIVGSVSSRNHILKVWIWMIDTEHVETPRRRSSYCRTWFYEFVTLSMTIRIYRLNFGACDVRGAQLHTYSPVRTSAGMANKRKNWK